MYLEEFQNCEVLFQRGTGKDPSAQGFKRCPSGKWGRVGGGCPVGPTSGGKVSFRGV